MNWMSLILDSIENFIESEKLFAEANVPGLLSSRLNKPTVNKIRERITKHDIQGVATIGAAVSDVWWMVKYPKPGWD